MSFQPNAKLDEDGTKVRVLEGPPIQVSKNPPGITWAAVEFPDGKLRPVNVDRLTMTDG